MYNVLSNDEREKYNDGEKIASVLRDLTGEFIVNASKKGIDVQFLSLKWDYNDGVHIIEGGA